MDSRHTLHMLLDKYASMLVYSDAVEVANATADTPIELAPVSRRHATFFVRHKGIRSERYVCVGGCDEVSHLAVWNSASGGIWNPDLNTWMPIDSLRKAVRPTDPITTKLLLAPKSLKNVLGDFSPESVFEEAVNNKPCNVIELRRPKDVIHLWVDSTDWLIRRIIYALNVVGYGPSVRRFEYTRIEVDGDEPPLSMFDCR